MSVFVINTGNFILLFPLCLPALLPGVQVAESKPLVVQADVLQRELESCLRREYTAENLPLILLQVRVKNCKSNLKDRSGI